MRTHFDQMGHFFHSLIPTHPASKRDDVAESVLGIHTHRSLKLDAANPFASPANFVRQGDIFVNDTGMFPKTDHIGFPCTHWLVASQTWTVTNGHFVSIVPGYTETTLKEHYESLGIRPPNPYSAVRENKKPRLVALPPHEILGIGDESLVFDMEAMILMASSSLKELSAIASLTFPAHAYMCNRLAQYLFRDVERWDDERPTNSKT